MVAPALRSPCAEQCGSPAWLLPLPHPVAEARHRERLAEVRYQPSRGAHHRRRVDDLRELGQQGDVALLRVVVLIPGLGSLDLPGMHAGLAQLGRVAVPLRRPAHGLPAAGVDAEPYAARARVPSRRDAWCQSAACHRPRAGPARWHHRGRPRSSRQARPRPRRTAHRSRRPPARTTAPPLAARGAPASPGAVMRTAAEAADRPAGHLRDHHPSARLSANLRAWRWQRMLDGGVYASVSEPDDAENISKSYVSRILRLALLAPNIIEAVLMAG